jgi:tellurite resistance protein TehA-like permease
LYFSYIFQALTIRQYGLDNTGYWLVTVYRILFWTYFAITFIAAVGLYCMLFTNPLLKIQDMTPAWDLPIFPYMLSGTIAASGVAYQPKEYAMPMLVAGVTAQGLGMLVSMCMVGQLSHRSTTLS